VSGAVGAVAAEVTSSLCVVGRAYGDELCRRGARYRLWGAGRGHLLLVMVKGWRG